MQEDKYSDVQVIPGKKKKAIFAATFFYRDNTKTEWPTEVFDDFESAVCRIVPDIEVSGNQFGDLYKIYVPAI